MAVAPFAGAGIEIFYDVSQSDVAKVAPFAGAWIEIYLQTAGRTVGGCRSLRGSVD